MSLFGKLWKTASGLATHEMSQSVKRHKRRRDVFAEAQAKAVRTGRPLLVVGDPDTGAHTSLARAYGCGHVCIDMTGCPACPHGIKTVLGEEAIPLESNHYVVYVSCTLELVENLPAAWKEIQRVAGSPENIFLVCIGPWSLTAYFYPGVKWRIFDKKDEGLIAQRIRDSKLVKLA